MSTAGAGLTSGRVAGAGVWSCVVCIGTDGARADTEEVEKEVRAEEEDEDGVGREEEEEGVGFLSREVCLGRVVEGVLGWVSRCTSASMASMSVVQIFRVVL